jgi:16S rRNA (guanine966-N2)-methyltransferase
MRVIAGIYRSRPLKSPPGLATRPTSDRLRETLFNVLAGRTEGARFADLYAGSGAVGIEALSRGARQVCFVEQAPRAVAAIRANLASLKIESGFHIDDRSVSAALADRARRAEPGPWDIVFLDPPYDAGLTYGRTLTILGKLEAPLLAPHGVVIAEHRRESRSAQAAAMDKTSLHDTYGALQRTRMLEQGDAALSFYEFSTK